MIIFINKNDDKNIHQEAMIKLIRCEQAYNCQLTSDDKTHKQKCIQKYNVAYNDNTHKQK